MLGSTRSCPSRQQLERLFGARQRMHAVAVGPQQQHRHPQPRVEVEQLALGAARPAARGARPRAREAGVAGHVGEGLAEEVGRGGVAARAERDPALRAEGRGGRVGEHHVEPGHGGRPGGDLDRRAQPAAGRRHVQAVGHQHQPRRREQAELDPAQQDLGAGVVARRPAGAARAPRPRSRPSPRRTSRSCRGGAGRCSESPWSGRSGRTTRKRSARPSTAGSHSLCESSPECSSASGGTGAGLAVGDAGSVAVVIEPQPHRQIVGARCRGHPELRRSDDERPAAGPPPSRPPRALAALAALGIAAAAARAAGTRRRGALWPSARPRACRRRRARTSWSS